MKKALLALAAAAALVLAVVLPFNTTARATGTPAPAAQKGERHPEIRMAIRHLEQAKESLEKAAHDFGGHRVKALEHVNQALEECHRAMETDEK